MALYVKALLAAMVAFAPGVHGATAVTITREKTGPFAQGYVDFDFTSPIAIPSTYKIVLKFMNTHFEHAPTTTPADCYIATSHASFTDTDPAKSSIGGKTTCVVTADPASTPPDFDTFTCPIGDTLATFAAKNQKIKVRCLGVKNKSMAVSDLLGQANMLMLLDSKSATVDGWASTSTLPAISVPTLQAATSSPIAFAQHVAGVSTTVTFKFSVPFGVALPLKAGDKFVYTDYDSVGTTGYALQDTGYTPTCTTPDFLLTDCSITNPAAVAGVPQRSELTCSIPTDGVTGPGRYTGQYLTANDKWDVTIICQVITGSSTLQRTGEFSLQRGVSPSLQDLATSDIMTISSFVVNLTPTTFAFDDLTKDRDIPSVFKLSILGVNFATVANDKLLVQLPRGTGLCTTDDVTRVASSGCIAATNCMLTEGSGSPAAVPAVLSSVIPDVLSISIDERTAVFGVVCENLKNSWRVGDSSFTSWFKVYGASNNVKSQSTPITQSIGNFVVSPDLSQCSSTGYKHTCHPRRLTHGRLLCFGGGPMSASTLACGGTNPCGSCANRDNRVPVCSYRGSNIGGNDAHQYFKAPTMQFYHAGHTFIEWNDMICAAGGGVSEGKLTNTQTVSKQIECWDKHPQHSWVQVTTPPAATKAEMDIQASTLSSRLLDGSAAVSWRGMICLTGGVVDDLDRTSYTGFKKIYFSTGTACTDDGNTWKHSVETTAPVLAMPQARAYHSAASFQGKLCVSGGYNLKADYSDAASIAYLTSVLCTSTGQLWQPFGELSAARSSHSMVVFRGELCVVGGSATFSYSDVDAFPLECTADGDDWRLYDGPKKNIRGGVAVDPTGVLFVPTLGSTPAWPAWNGVSSYDEQGWRGVNLRVEPWVALGGCGWHWPAAFSFTATTGSWSAQGDKQPHYSAKT